MWLDSQRQTHIHTYPHSAELREHLKNFFVFIVIENGSSCFKKAFSGCGSTYQWQAWSYIMLVYSGYITEKFWYKDLLECKLYKQKGYIWVANCCTGFMDVLNSSHLAIIAYIAWDRTEISLFNHFIFLLLCYNHRNCRCSFVIFISLLFYS